MKLKIKHKLFLILVSASVLIISCMFIFTRISFERGLIRYVDKMEMKHLESMARILEENYDREKSWDFLKNDPESWELFQRYTFRQWRSMGRNSCAPGYMDGRGQDHGPAYVHPGNMGPMMRMHKNMRGRGPSSRPGLVLLDQDKKPLFGEGVDPDNMRMLPVVNQGKNVGFLGLREPCSVVEDEELLFFKRQSRVFLTIALCMVLVAVLVAVWTAYYLEGPIQSLTRGTKDLASGLYKTRIPVKSNDELGQLSRDFNTLASTLEENEKDRKKWVEDIAHELRTPLTLLSGELEAVEDGIRELTDDTLKRLKGDIQHLIILVNDLNELSSTDQGTLSYRKEATDLVVVVKRVFEKFHDGFSEHQLQWEDLTKGLTKAMVFADPERLNQLFVNLLQNSLTYTRSGGKISIRVTCEQDMVYVDLEDSEPGVPEEALPRLFDRLYRVETSRNRKYGGSGIGLAICRNIVEAHGGTITARSSSLGGLWIRTGIPLHEGGA